MAKRDEEELRTRLESLERERDIKVAVAHAVKIRCSSFWGVVMVVIGCLGSWASENIRPIKAGFAAFWEALGGQ